MKTSATDRIRKTTVASVHVHYVAKAEKKGRGRAEVDKTDFETFFAQAPAMNPNRFLITGVICGYRVEEIEDPFMRELRHLDKLVDEVSKGKAMEKVLRLQTP